MLMISGESMKKHVTLKQTHLGTKQKNILFKGYLELLPEQDNISFHYIESDQTTVVEVRAEQDSFYLKRSGEMITELCFRENEKTRGTIRSEYGTIELTLFTHKYIQKDNIIAIEYDVMVNGEVSDSFRFLCTMKEVMA